MLNFSAGSQRPEMKKKINKFVVFIKGNMELIPSSEINFPKSGIFANNNWVSGQSYFKWYELAKIIFVICVKQLRWLVDWHFVEKWYKLIWRVSVGFLTAGHLVTLDKQFFRCCRNIFRSKMAQSPLIKIGPYAYGCGHCCCWWCWYSMLLVHQQRHRMAISWLL